MNFGTRFVFISKREPLRISSHTGAGLAALLTQIEIRLGLAAQEDTPSRSNSGLERQLSERHRQALDQALQELAQAQVLLGEKAGLDLVAEALRGAGIVLGTDYPHPIADLRESRQAALSAYDGIKGSTA